METIKFELDQGSHGGFNLYSEGKKQGEMFISINNDLLTVFHTGIEPRGRGKGFAKKLLDEMVAYATEMNLKVLPLCPYVQAQFKRCPEQYGSYMVKIT